MKVIVFSDTSELFSPIIEKEGHAIVAETNSMARLPALIAEHRPHLVFAESSEHIEEDITRLASIFTSTRFVILGFERGKSWRKVMRQALRSQRIKRTWPSVLPDEPKLIRDPRYFGFCDGKRISTNGEPNTEEIGIEASRLLWMLRMARELFPRAEVYRDAANNALAFEWQELAMSTLQGSYKSPAFARDLLGRSLGYLAHFVPGVDLEGLPPAIDDPPAVRFLHFDAPGELRYAIFCLALFGFDEEVGKHLYRAAQWRLAPDNEKETTFCGLTMSGVAFTLHRVCWAQSTVIPWLLDPGARDRIHDKRPRALQRALRTFALWWGLRTLVDSNFALTSVLDQLHASSEPEPLPTELQIPNYAAFLKASADFKNPNPRNNKP
jgi:hypothetical protein